MGIKREFWNSFELGGDEGGMSTAVPGSLHLNSQLWKKSLQTSCFALFVLAASTVYSREQYADNTESLIIWSVDFCIFSRHLAACTVCLDSYASAVAREGTYLVSLPCLLFVSNLHHILFSFPPFPSDHHSIAAVVSPSRWRSCPRWATWLSWRSCGLSRCDARLYALHSLV